MNQRIQMMVLVLLTVAIIAVLAFSWMSMQRAQETNQAMLAALTKLAQAGPSKVAGESNWVKFRVKILVGNSNRLMPGLRVVIDGNPFRDGENSRESIDETTDGKGSILFGPIRPGRYRLNIFKPRSYDQQQSDSNAFNLQKEIVLYPGNEIKEMVFHYPEVTMVPVKVKIDLPPAMKDKKLLFECGIAAAEEDSNASIWNIGKDVSTDAQGEQLAIGGFARRHGNSIEFKSKAKQQHELPARELRLLRLTTYIQESKTSSQLEYYSLWGRGWSREEATHRFTPKSGSQNEWQIHLDPADLNELQKRLEEYQNSKQAPAPQYPPPAPPTPRP